MVVHVLTTLLYLTIAAVLHVARGKLEIYEAGKCKQGIDDVIITDVSFASCTDECKARDWCTGVSYLTRAHFCRVHGSNATEQSNGDCKQSVYSERNDWHEQDFPSESPRCDQSRATADQLTCQYQDCPVPSITDVLQLFGNLRTVGAKIAFRCDKEHVLNGKSSLTCLPGGNWNGNVPSCTVDTSNTTPVSIDTTSTTRLTTLVQTTSSTTTTTTAYPNGFEDINGYMLMVVIKQTMTYDQAHNACAVHSASLVRIDSPEKQETIQAHIVTLSGDNECRYWIQCLLDITDGVWKFDDGTPVPMTNNYWGRGPSDPNFSGDCGYMYSGFNFLWTNYYLCSATMGYICEIQ